MSEQEVIVLETEAFDVGDIYLTLSDEQKAYVDKMKEEIARLQNKNQFLKDYLDLSGVDINILERVYKEQEKVRLELKDELESDDELIKEKANKQLSDVTINALMPIVNEHRYQKEKSEIENILINKLTPEIWNYLDDDSKTFLITACFTFYQLQNNHFEDYSCVCMLITKALENEATRCYFDRYITHLQNKHIPIDKWPNAITSLNPYTNKINIIKRDDYTLGSVVYTAGLRNKSAHLSKVDLVISYKEEDKAFFELFKNYYLSSLLRVGYIGEEERIFSDCNIIEYARINYRNPSAHKMAMDEISAKSCIDYLLLDERKLYYLLKDLRH